MLPCAGQNGEYGVKDLYIGVPVVIGKNGVEKIVEVQFTQAEKAAFDKSCAAVRDLIEAFKSSASDAMNIHEYRRRNS